MTTAVSEVLNEGSLSSSISVQLLYFITEPQLFHTVISRINFGPIDLVSAAESSFEMFDLSKRFPSLLLHNAGHICLAWARKTKE
jgi:hypothetical protein